MQSPYHNQKWNHKFPDRMCVCACRLPLLISIRLRSKFPALLTNAILQGASSVDIVVWALLRQLFRLQSSHMKCEYCNGKSIGLWSRRAFTTNVKLVTLLQCGNNLRITWKWRMNTHKNENRNYMVVTLGAAECQGKAKRTIVKVSAILFAYICGASLWGVNESFKRNATAKTHNGEANRHGNETLNTYAVYCHCGNLAFLRKKVNNCCDDITTPNGMINASWIMQ